MKVVKSVWRCKLSKENIEALLHLKVEGPEIEQFIKEHLVMQQRFGGLQRNKEKERMGNRKHKKLVPERKIKQLWFTNKFIGTFLESSSDEDEGNVIQYISNSETELEFIKNLVKRVRWSFLRKQLMAQSC